MRHLFISLTILLLLHTAAAAQVQTPCAGASSHLITRHADAGDVDAQLRLFQILGQSHCTDDEFRSALTWLHRAADANHPDANFLLGIRYITGIDVTEDQARGLQLIERSAQAGHGEAQFQFAMLLLEARSSRKEQEQGLYWLGKAASEGDTKAALTLGHIYAAGLHGVARQDCWATDWFDAATDLALDARIDVTELIPSDLDCQY